jgi:hypothetical protein
MSLYGPLKKVNASEFNALNPEDDRITTFNIEKRVPIGSVVRWSHSSNSLVYKVAKGYNGCNRNLYYSSKRRHLTPKALSWIEFDKLQRPSIFKKRTGDVFVIGDLHGDLETIKDILQKCGIITYSVTGDVVWTGGKSMIVQTGDILDRGPSSRSMIRFFMDLEKAAFIEGGCFIMTLGNHELMNLFGVSRYVNPLDDEEWGLSPQNTILEGVGEFKIFEGEQFDEERLKVFKNSEEGQWLTKQPVVVRILQDYFMHGGLSLIEELTDDRIRKINDDIQKILNPNRTTSEYNNIAEEKKDVWDILWNREFEQENEETLCSKLSRMKLETRYFVGHSTQNNGRIRTRCNNRILLVDVGLSPYSDMISSPNQRYSFCKVWKRGSQILRIGSEEGRLSTIEI